MSLTAAERERRAGALQQIVGEHELDVLLPAGAGYRGHKGPRGRTATRMADTDTDIVRVGGGGALSSDHHDLVLVE